MGRPARWARPLRAVIAGLAGFAAAAGLVVAVGAAPAAATGVSWVQLSPAASPPARSGAAMAYDPALGKVVLFGGYGPDPTTALSDTWTFDGATWTADQRPVHPAGRLGAGLAYDPALGALVLFGGTAAGRASAQTWAYDGSGWRQLSPARAPTARSGAAMAYDPAIGRIVLYGGTSSAADVLGDTWAFDGATWTDVSPATPRDPATAPPVLTGASMAYDPSAGAGPGGRHLRQRVAAVRDVDVRRHGVDRAVRSTLS